MNLETSKINLNCFSSSSWWQLPHVLSEGVCTYEGSCGNSLVPFWGAALPDLHVNTSLHLMLFCSSLKTFSDYWSLRPITQTLLHTSKVPGSKAELGTNTYSEAKFPFISVGGGISSFSSLWESMAPKINQYIRKCYREGGCIHEQISWTLNKEKLIQRP